MTTLETYAERLAGIDGDGLSTERRERLALHVIDNVGAWIAGIHTTEGRALAAFGRKGASGDLAAAVALASAQGRLSEIDNIHLQSTTTPGGVVVPAVLTIAAALGSDAAALRAAIVAGNEAMIRLGLAIGGPTVLYRGIWPTYFAAPFAVAAATARLMRLDAPRTAQALAGALTLVAPCVGHHNAATTTRWLAVGNAARSGFVAASAAADGFTSDIGLLDGPFFEAVYGVKPKLAAFSGETGAQFMLDDISFKPWCAARQTMAGSQALRELLAEGLQPDDIEAITVMVPPAMHKMIDHGVVAGDRASHLTSLPYHLAIAACDPAAADAVGQSPTSIADPVRAFMAKVTVLPEEAFMAHFPETWPARIMVQAKSGNRDRLVLHIPGDPARPYARAEVEAKFRRFVGGVVDGTKTEALLAAASSASAQDGAAAALVAAVTGLSAK